jgi:hypothetical protein
MSEIHRGQIDRRTRQEPDRAAGSGTANTNRIDEAEGQQEKLALYTEARGTEENTTRPNRSGKGSASRSELTRSAEAETQQEE